MFWSVTRNGVTLHTPPAMTRTSYSPSGNLGAGPLSPNPGGTVPYRMVAGSASAAAPGRRAMAQRILPCVPRPRPRLRVVTSTRSTGIGAALLSVARRWMRSSLAGPPRSTSPRTATREPQAIDRDRSRNAARNQKPRCCLTPRAKLWASPTIASAASNQKIAHQLQRSLGRLRARSARRHTALIPATSV